MRNKLKIKDLVSIGVFAVIYFAMMFGVGMMGLVPIMFLIYPTILGITTGVIVMLFMAKVQKPWALFILGIISPAIMFSMGHTYVVMIHGLIIMAIAEFIRRLGDYKSFKYNMISFAVFNTWICGSLMQMLLVREKYIAMTETFMGTEYTSALEKLITYPNMAIVYIGAIIGGVIGAYIGRAILKKHFEKAGIV